mgnify:CR=1 FL=1
MKVQITAGAAVVLLLLCLVLMCAGCAPMEGATTANPVARIQIEPLRGVVKMESSRDDKATLGELTANIPENAPGPLAGTKLTVKDLDLDASASKVRKANVGQIAGMGQFNQDTGDAWATVIDSAGGVVGQVMPRLYPNTGAEIAKTFSYLFLIVLVCAIVAGAVIAVVLFGKLWRWAFPPKDATQALLVELMRAKDNGTAGK